MSALPVGFLVVCSVCGQALEARTAFGAGQLKKKHPRCRSCAPNKFSNYSADGRQSRRENRRAQELSLLQKAGLIRDLREQVSFELIPAQTDSHGKVLERSCAYVADFVYSDPTGKLHVEDAKGMRTDVYRLKKKLMLWVHHISIEEV